MRAGAVGLTRLEDADETVDAARCIAELTHADVLAGDAWVIWSLAVRRAVLDGTFDGAREGLDHIPTTRRGQWAAWLDEAETGPATRFNPNGFTVHALQAAWSATTPTRWLPSLAHCSERGGVHRRCPPRGVAGCTVGRGCGRTTWYGSAASPLAPGATTRKVGRVLSTSTTPDTATSAS